MDKFLRIAVMLTAVDRMSSVVNGAVDRSIQRMRDLEDRTQKAQTLMGAGLAQIASGVAIAAAMSPALNAFVELEDAGARMKASLLEAGNVLPTESYERLSRLAVRLGDELPGTTADFYDMFTKMRQLGVETETILSGAGEAAAHLAVVLGLPFDQTSTFVAKLKEATGTADKDLKGFIDTIARTANMGVKTEEMMLAFGRSAPALKTLNIQGAEASKSISALYAMLIKGGLSGETAGTNMMTLLNQLMDSGTISKMNKALAELGKAPMRFSDAKSGQFLGVENMIAQFDKLQTLNPQQISDVVAAGFGPGMDAGIVKVMAAAGVKGFNAMQEAMNKQATLEDKVKVQLSTLSAQWEATSGAWGNTMATMFKPMGEALTPLVKQLGDAASAIGRFAEKHPDLFKIAGILTSVASGFLIVSGVIKAARAAMIAFNIVSMMNPIGLIIAAVVAAALLIYTYWGPISGFFTRLWASIKNAFFAAWDWIKAVFLNYTPYGQIIKNWGTIVDAFRSVFQRVWDFFASILDRFREAGANIVGTIADGIMSGIDKVKDAIGRVTAAAREYLPFSPAKQGAFRDLHKVKIVETIAGAVNPAPLTRAMAGVTSKASAVASPVSSRSAGGFNYSPTITINGATGIEDFRRELNKHKDEIIRIFKEDKQRGARLSYS